jgi:aspartate/methionine/tyrosine aminotransferase
VAEQHKRFYDLAIDPDKEVMIACATEGLMASFHGLLNPGDEAVVIEPFFDSYVPQIKSAGGVPKFARLNPPDWRLDEKTLRAAFSPRTKLLVINTPLNPVGRVFTRDELAMIARLLEEFDAYAVCDEVYEHMVFDGRKHIPLMTLPGMRERCVRIGSAGKTFSMTGWRVGYLTACPALIKPIAGAHQYITFTLPGALQTAVAAGLRAGDDYYSELTQHMQTRRDILAKGLAEAGFKVLPCEGTYFLTADFAALAVKTGFKGGDQEFCVWLTEQAKVTAIPLSPFYAPENGEAPRTLIRFCFAKKIEVLEQAIDRLKAFFRQ